MKSLVIVSEAVVRLDQDGNIFFKGGGEVSVHKFAVVAKECGFDVQVFGINEEEKVFKEFVCAGVKYTIFPAGSKTSFFGIIRYLLWLRKKMRDFDVVILNQFVPQLLIPACSKKAVALVHDVYGSISFWWKNYKFVGLFGWLIEKCSLNFMRIWSVKVITVSEASKSKLNLCGIQNVEVIPNYVEGPNVAAVEKRDYILFVSRLIDYKRPFDVIEALRLLNSQNFSIKAVFVFSRVDTALLIQLMSLVESYKLGDQVGIHTKPVSGVVLSDLYSKARLLVHTSEVEGQGLVLAEAIAHNTKVIAYNLPAYSYLSRQVKTGNLILLDEIGKISELAESIKVNFDDYKVNSKIKTKNTASFEYVKQKFKLFIGRV